MAKDFDHIKAEARAYGMECKEADRPVVMGDFCDRLGKGRHWLSSTRSVQAEKARAIVLREWAALGVKACSVLGHALAQAALTHVANAGQCDRDWVIPESDWPQYHELTVILAEGQRREMFTDLRNRYGREVAMRYAYVCANPSEKGARQGKNSFDVAVSA